jgi:hypothetical protein
METQSDKRLDVATSSFLEKVRSLKFTEEEQLVLQKVEGNA